MEQTNSLITNEINTNVANNQSLQPTTGMSGVITDLGAALVFGIGFYFFKSHFKKKGKDEKEIKDKMKPLKEKLEDTINKWENSVSLQKINTLIKQEVTDKTFDPFAVLDQLQNSSMTPDITIINTLLDTSCRLKDFKNFNRLCELICSQEGITHNLPAPNVVTYNVILKGFNMEQYKRDINDKSDKEIIEQTIVKVEKTVRHMIDFGLKPNDITLNTIIDIMVDAGNFDLAWKYYDEMEKIYGIEPDIYTYSTLLKSIKNHEPDHKNIERAFNILKIVKLSKAKGIKPDEILYNCILDTCVKYNRIKQAESVFADMKEAKIVPSKITYAIMIKAYGTDHNFEKALGIFNEMKLTGITPNEIIYGCLLNAAVKSSKIEKALDIYDEIKNSEVPMNIILYSTLIKGYTKIKNFSKAFEIYKRMEADSTVEINTIAYNAILDSCVECGDMKMLNKIYNIFKDRAENDESCPQPDLITFSTVIKGYCKQKNIEKVIDIYNYLKGRNDFILDEVMYNTILDGMLKAEKYDEALKVYDHMRTNGVKKSNATYSILIKIYSKQNSVTQAVEVYNEMLEAEIKPSLITYTSILQILIKSKRIQNAIEIFDEILFNELSPDQVMYNVIINGCIFNGRLSEACRFLMKSFVANLKLCSDVYKNILNNLLTNKIMNFDQKIEITMKICKELKNRGLKIEYELYYRVMKMIYKSNGRKADSFAQKETDDYKSTIESQRDIPKNDYYNKKKNYFDKNNSHDTQKNYNNNNNTQAPKKNYDNNKSSYPCNSIYKDETVIAEFDNKSKNNNVSEKSLYDDQTYENKPKKQGNWRQKTTTYNQW